MPKGPIRRAQLIAPFGVGGITVVRDGTSLVGAGLDHWYERESGDAAGLNVEEYRIEEWRLQERLQVDHFRLPPDYRMPHRGGQTPNAGLTAPFLRFPQWHFCPVCKLLKSQPLVLRGRPKCPECEVRRNRRVPMLQVRFIAMCDAGHLQDFPWREWVHREAEPACALPIRLIATGSASLAGEVIRCECGRERSLSGIMEAGPDSSFLTRNLRADGVEYPCRGRRPWLGTEEDGPCPKPLRGTLPSASNVYFAHVRSSIYLPRGTATVPSELTELFEQPPVSTTLSAARDLGGLDLLTPAALRARHGAIFQPYADEQIAEALGIVLGGQSPAVAADPGAPDGEDPEMTFRRAEHEALCSGRREGQLLVRVLDPAAYRPDVAPFFSRISLVDRLKETRALAGFSRVFPENGQGLDERKALLWRQQLPVPCWLPAYIVYGEGIFLEFAPDRLRDWERRGDVQGRVNPVMDRYRRVQTERRLRERPLGPRFVLLHTFAHLLMNRLTFECGYSSAALRERLYVSDDPACPMAGVLIYTASGDAEGTMGGLVRMGKPGYLEPVIRRALEIAGWCSADPVCMEVGTHGGQGPDSCNLAACHNCALVPETACEEFNRFLDRGTAVGTAGDRGLGYFSTLIRSP